MNVRIYRILGDFGISALAAHEFRGIQPGSLVAQGFIPIEGDALFDKLDVYTTAICFRQDKIDIPRETLQREVEIAIRQENHDGRVSRVRRAEITDEVKFDLARRALPKSKTVWATLTDSDLYVYTGSASLADALVQTFESATGAKTAPSGIIDRCFGRLEEALTIPACNFLLPDTSLLGAGRSALANDAGAAAQALEHLGPEALLWFMYHPKGVEAGLDFCRRVDFTGEVKSSMRSDSPQFSPEATSAVRAGRVPVKCTAVVKAPDSDMSWEVVIRGDGFQLEKVAPLLLNTPGGEDDPLEQLLIDHLEVDRVDRILDDLFGQFLDRALDLGIFRDLNAGLPPA